VSGVERRDADQLTPQIVEDQAILDGLPSRAPG
jgi:hypothetical protein